LSFGNGHFGIGFSEDVWKTFDLKSLIFVVNSVFLFGGDKDQVVVPENLLRLDFQVDTVLEMLAIIFLDESLTVQVCRIKEHS
jgi:hypothetical protein